MTDYIQVSFACSDPSLSDILLAKLSEAGYEGFEEKEEELLCFIPADLYNEELVRSLADELNATWSKLVIPRTNWNEVWESNFKPVVVDDFCTIRAEFHEPVKNAEHEIIITPKQSFGTGHHATTYMMIQNMRDIDFKGKHVFDFGTGTGVLGILAEKLGAASVLAIDIDEWSIENATENAKRNNCGKVKIEKGEAVPAATPFDIILANINKNVILDHLPSLTEILTSGGTVLFSGLLEEDRDDLLKAAEPRLIFTGMAEQKKWICLKFNKL